MYTAQFCGWECATAMSVYKYCGCLPVEFNMRNETECLPENMATDYCVKRLASVNDSDSDD